jgi:hypothetical protein
MLSGTHGIQDGNFGVKTDSSVRLFTLIHAYFAYLRLAVGRRSAEWRVRSAELEFERRIRKYSIPPFFGKFAFFRLSAWSGREV